MAQAHRISDLRTCGAATIVGSAPDRNVYVNGLLISVTGDVNSDGGGVLTGTARNVLVKGLPVVVVGSPSGPDSLCPIPGGPHCAPAAASGSTNVLIGT